MQYAVFDTLNGVPTVRTNPGLKGIHDELREAMLWLSQNHKSLPRPKSEYVIEPVNEQGLRMEKVDDLESEALGVQAAELVRTDEDIRLGVGMMIAARQLHVSAHEEVTRKLDKLRETQDIPELIDSVIYQTAAAGAEGHFSNVELAAKIPSLAEWIRRVCEQDREAQLTENREMIERSEEERREMPIYLPFEPIKGKGLEWDRKGSLCFAGDPVSVRYLLNYLEREIGSIRQRPGSDDPEDRLPWQQILRFAIHARDNDLPTTQLPQGVWLECAKSENQLDRVFEAAGKFMGTACDVVMVDSAEATRKPLSGANPMSAANHAHKLFRERCRKFGACLIMGIVIQDYKVLTCPASQRLQSYTTLRRVSHKEEDGQIFLYLGERQVAGPVPKSDLKLEGESIIKLT